MYFIFNKKLLLKTIILFNKFYFIFVTKKKKSSSLLKSDSIVGSDVSKLESVSAFNGSVNQHNEAMKKARRIAGMNNYVEEEEDLDLDDDDSLLFDRHELDLINESRPIPEDKTETERNEEKTRAFIEIYPGPPNSYQKLPIAQKRKEIVDLIEENPFTIILGGTGCGKTTQVNKTKQKILGSNNFKKILK